MATRRAPNWPLIGILLLSLAGSLLWIERFPKAWTDTSWLAVRGYTLATEGRLATPVLRGVQHRDEHLLLPILVHPVLLGATYELAGFGLWQSRAPSILAGLLLALLTYWFAREYQGRGIALLATAFLCADNLFFVSSRVVRPDLLLALLSSAGVFLAYHGLHKGSLRHIALAGAAMGVALCTHPHALLILLGILLLLLQRFGPSLLRAREPWWFAAFVLLALSPYVAHVAIEDGANGFSHLGEQLGGRLVLAREGFLHGLGLEIRRYADYLFFPKRLLIGVVQLAALVYGLRSPRPLDRQLSSVVLGAILFFPILRPYNGNSLYLVILIPFLSILVASAYFRARSWVAARPALAAVALLYGLNGLIGNATVLFLHRSCEPEPYFARIRAHIPPGASVLGPMDLWLGLHEHPYVTPAVPAAEVSTFRPDYVLLYDRTNQERRTAITGRARTSVSEILPEDDGAARALALEGGVRVGRVEDGCYEAVEIHALRWGS